MNTRPASRRSGYRDQDERDVRSTINARNQIERLFNKLKNWRRVTTRHSQTK